MFVEMVFHLSSTGLCKLGHIFPVYDTGETIKDVSQTDSWVMD